MSSPSKVIWTVLPNGIDDTGRRCRLSIRISPRLQAGLSSNDPVAGAFRNWPQALLGIAGRLVLEVDGQTVRPDIDLSPLRNDLWETIFADVDVTPYAMDRFYGCFIRSFPAKMVAEFVKERYREVARQSPLEFPARDWLRRGDRFGQIAFYGERKIDAENRLKKYIEKKKRDKIFAPTLKDIQSVSDAFYLARDFHQGAKNPDRTPLTEPKFDFHEVVASLADYPAVMRWLGLVLDLTFGMADISAQPRGIRVRVHPPVPFNGTQPVTLCDIGPSLFTAAARGVNPPLKRGILNLGDPERYQIHQLDVDGAALKLMDFAAMLDRTKDFVSADTPEASSLPALRSTGIGLFRIDSARQCSDAFRGAEEKEQQFEGGGDVTLFAEDLVAGYRADVWDSVSKRWHSLHLRSGRYRFGDSVVPAAHEKNMEDEGWSSASVTRKPEAQAGASSDPDLYVHEALLCWDGWSLSARRPGSGIGSPENRRDEDIVDPAAAPSKFVPFGADFLAKAGSLPRLRFGRDYRLRLRPVDLAGNGPKLSDLPEDQFDGCSPSMGCRRYEPVPSPAMVPGCQFDESPGESLERLVIRTHNDTTAANTAPTDATSERHVVPPRGSQWLAECCGKFDGARKLQKKAYALIVQREGVLPTCFSSDNDALFNLPYLPDPYCKGAAFVDLPGAPVNTNLLFPVHGHPIEAPAVAASGVPPAAVIRVAFGTGGAWHDAKPFRLRLKEGRPGDRPEWDPFQRVLTVRLTKAEVRTVRLSAWLDKEDLARMAIWALVQEDGDAGPALEGPALEGRVWLLTPYRPVTLVHAVQKPLLNPDVQDLKPRRTLGQARVDLRGSVTVHGESTQKIDLAAEWQEPVDDPEAGLPRCDGMEGMVPDRNNEVAPPLFCSAKVAELPVHFDPKSSAGRPPRYPYLPENLQLVFDPGRIEGAQEIHHELADTRRRKITYHCTAVTRFREYFKPDRDSNEPVNPEMEIKAFTVPGRSKMIDVPSSAPPAPPAVVSIVPTFTWIGWKRLDGGAKLRRTRRGGGLRIYLDRPWFSSGEGELLGVVSRLETDRESIPESFAPSLFTQWGLDPIWKAGSLFMTPGPKELLGAVRKMDGLPLAQDDGRTVAVTGYPVGFDRQRGLWYADIDIRVGSLYFPFIRLALVRLQPHAVDGAHLSKVVLADFVQITPHRTATVTFIDRARTHLMVSVVGPGYERSGAGNTPSRLTGIPIDLGKGPGLVEIALEKKNTQIPDKDLGWEEIEGTRRVLPPRCLQTRQNPVYEWALAEGKAVSVPRSSDGAPIRLVIREFERLPEDPPAGGCVKLGLRLVYAEALEL